MMAAAARAASSATPVVSEEQKKHNARVEEYIQTHGIAPKVAQILRDSSHYVQKDVIRRVFMDHVRNKDGMLVNRINQSTEHFTKVNQFLTKITAEGIDS